MSRYLKKIEKDEAYLDSVSGLGNIFTPLVLGNSVSGRSLPKSVFFIRDCKIKFPEEGFSRSA